MTLFSVLFRRPITVHGETNQFLTF